MDVDEREPGTSSIEIPKDTKEKELKDIGDRANESLKEIGFLDLSYTIRKYDPQNITNSRPSVHAKNKHRCQRPH